MPCRLRVAHPGGALAKVKGFKTLTPRNILEHNLDDVNIDSPMQIQVHCRKCGSTAVVLRASDTKEKLHRELRELVTHDKSLPLLYDRGFHQIDLPADASEVCGLAHKFPSEALEPLIFRVGESLSRGALRFRLKAKMEAKPPAEEKLTYLRVGVGLKALGRITAVLELWPMGHTSPKHQHGGCAGSVRVLHGVLDVRLYENIFTEEPMEWKHGDGGLTIPGSGKLKVLQLKKDQTTWMNRCHWFCHEVHCNPAHGANHRNGFACSLHVYKSCTDQFEFASGSELIKGDPKNDFFWNVDLDADDERLHEDVPDFMASLEPLDRETP